MKTWIISALAALATAGLASAAPIVLKLTDGSVLKGDLTPPSSPTATEVVMKTEFGVIRVPVAKLDSESRKAAGIGQPNSHAQYEAQIARLEERVKQLEAENARLRREQASGSSGSTATPAPNRPPAANPVYTPSPQPAASGLSYSRSSTGKRHNSRCRYFGSGSSCGPNDGIACKICGG